MPPIPPMPPPPGGIPAPPWFFFGTSATMASVVIRSAATDEAFCIAMRTTLVGSMMPFAQFWPHWAVIWIVPGIFFVGQTMSDYLLSPYFVGRRVNLNPVWIMFALFAFGYLFGFVGLLIAVPLASAIGVLTRFALQRYYESFFYTAIPGTTVTDAVRLTPSDKKMD